MRGWWGRPASTRSFFTIISIGAVAAVIALVVGVRPLFEKARQRQRPSRLSADAEETSAAGRGTRGGPTRPGLVVWVGASTKSGSERIAAPDRVERLAPRERLRMGVRPGPHGFLFAISIDGRGTVTALYPEAGASLPVSPGAGMTYMPDGLELTGAGAERLIVLLSDQPLQWLDVRAAAETAFQRAGRELGKLSALDLGGAEFQQMFTKL